MLSHSFPRGDTLRSRVCSVLRYPSAARVLLGPDCLGVGMSLGQVGQGLTIVLELVGLIRVTIEWTSGEGRERGAGQGRGYRDHVLPAGVFAWCVSSACVLCGSMYISVCV